MAKITTYKITIINWEKHNPKIKLKAGYTHFMLSKRFFHDQKILQLSANESLLFINLLSIAADLMCDSFTIHTRLLLDSLRLRDKSLSNALMRFQELQLLTFEKVVPNRIEEKRKEEKRKEGDTDLKNENKRIAVPAEQPTQKSNLAIAKYCELWKDRYKASPPIGKKEAGQIARLVKEHGLEKTNSFIEAYLQMPDPWFIKKRHDISTLVSNLNAVSQFLATGRLITNREITQIDTTISHQNILNMIDRGEI